MAAAPKSIVILGAGQAGAWAARALRDHGYAQEIQMVSAELHEPYERPPLSKALLAGKADPASTRVFSPAVLASLGLQWHCGVPATALDRASKRVTLADGSALAYDKLLFCTGGRALRPPIAGMDLPGVFTLRTLDDSLRIAAALADAQRVCIIGGGWISLEVSSTAVALGKQVTLLQKSSSLCERVLPPALADHLALLHRQAGVELRLDTGAEAIQKVAERLRVVTTSGSAVEADVVVVGAGLVPNDELATQAGLQCARGIVVDARCVTSDPDILAAGDVAVAPNVWADGLVRLESWQNATDQAVVAAQVALGADLQYSPLPWFWSDQHGVNLQIYGWPMARHRAVTRQLGTAGSFLTFLLEGDKVASAVAWNAARELRMARKLIESRKPVCDADLANPDLRLSAI